MYFCSHIYHSCGFIIVQQKCTGLAVDILWAQGMKWSPMVKLNSIQIIQQCSCWFDDKWYLGLMKSQHQAMYIFAVHDGVEFLTFSKTSCLSYIIIKPHECGFWGNRNTLVMVFGPGNNTHDVIEIPWWHWHNRGNPCTTNVVSDIFIWSQDSTGQILLVFYEIYRVGDSARSRINFAMKGILACVC
jgi:hypothetical protein